MVKESPRSYALDALRGLAILGMALSGRLPWGALPAWMYHAQEPPPEMVDNANVFGITWVDLVFPFFLFAMGAAIPLALSKRLERGDTEPQLIGKIFLRGVLLALFAITSQHFRPGSLDLQGFRANEWMAIGLFFAMLMAWMTPPSKWGKALRFGINGLGWGMCIAAATLLTFKNPVTWSWERSDIILLVLANVAVSGGLAYIASRRWKPALPVIFCVAIVWFFLKTEPWFAPIHAWSPVKWLFNWEFHKYLMIVIPGIWAGEILGRWLNSEETGEVKSPDSSTSSIKRGIVLCGIAMSFIVCEGLLSRHVISTIVWSFIVGVMCLIAISKFSGKSKLLQPLATFGFALLMIGLLIEPVGGGIRKDPTTISYFFVSAGLAFWMLLALVMIEDLRASKGRQGTEESTDSVALVHKPGFLAMVGANPMIGYIAITNLTYGLVRVTGLNDWVGNQGWDPWTLAGYGLFQTFLVGIVAVIATRFKIYMKS